MTESIRYSPKVENLSRPCQYWSLKRGCGFPKREMEGRRSCEGIVDDVCLYLKDKRRPKSLTFVQLLEIKTRIPGDNLDIPPGDVKK